MASKILLFMFRLANSIVLVVSTSETASASQALKHLS